MLSVSQVLVAAHHFVGCARFGVGIRRPIVSVWQGAC